MRFRELGLPGVVAVQAVDARPGFLYWAACSTVERQQHHIEEEGKHVNQARRLLRERKKRAAAVAHEEDDSDAVSVAVEQEVADLQAAAKEGAAKAAAQSWCGGVISGEQVALCIVASYVISMHAIPLRAGAC
jgi:hypothetical protein